MTTRPVRLRPSRRPSRALLLLLRAAAAVGLPVATASATLATPATPATSATPPTASIAPSPALPPARLAEHQASFDQIWRTVREKHWDPESIADSWDAAHERLRPRLLEVATDDDARGVMLELLGSLGQSHFDIIPAEAYAAMDEEGRSAARPGEDAAADAADDGSGGWHGLEVRLVGEDLLVTRVDEGSPAALAGVRPGWILRSVGDRPVAGIIAVADELAGGVTSREMIAAQLVSGRLWGSPGETVTATFLGDAPDTPEGDTPDTPDTPLVTATITLGTSPDPMYGIGNLPPMPVAVESRTLEGGIGYFRLGVFMGPDRVMPAWRAFLAAHAEAPGIVLDLRGNPGGLIAMSGGLLNFLVSERGLRMGTMHMRDPERGPFEFPLMINPWADSYSMPLAVLVDELSASNSEILAAAVQDLGRGHIVGGRTAGLVLPSTVELLPNGDGFLHAFAGYDRSRGDSLEGVGVEPDVAVAPSRAALLAGVDPVLATAVSLLSSGVPVGDASP
jgi:carboxyl-terminal processing protease